MRINNKRKKLLISALLGIISALVMFSMYNSMEKKLSSQSKLINDQVQTIDVIKKTIGNETANNTNVEYEYLVASMPLAKGSVFKPTDFVKQKSPIQIMQAISDESSIIGRTLLFDVKQGSFLKEDLFGGSISNNNVPAGMRLVTIPSVAIQGLASYIKVGTRVDIISIAKDKDSNSEILLQNIKIVSMEPKTSDQKIIASASDSSAITFLVPLQSTTKLIETFTLGKIQLIARGDEDRVVFQQRTGRRVFTKQISSSNLPAITSIPEKLPAPAMPQPVQNNSKVEMIQANNKSEVTFE
jgi:Flp pilus assembly protein CpaB